MTKPPFRLALVGANANTRKAVEKAFARSKDFRFLGAYADGEIALRQLPARTPHAVLLETHLPGISGVECLRRLKAIRPETRVVMLASSDDNKTFFQSLAAGADGYLLKNGNMRQLLESVREAVNGGALVPPRMTRWMLECFRHRELPPPVAGAAASESVNLRALTPRERQVLAGFAEGLVPKEIAASIGISKNTVRNIATSIYTKLRVHSRSEAILKYLGRKEPATPPAPTD